MIANLKRYFFLCIFIFPALVWAEEGQNTATNTPLSYLKMMTEAHQKSNYELLYILQQQNESAASFRLRHTFVNNKEYAQLLNLDHNREEIILNNQRVSYLGKNFRPFSLTSPHIWDNLPSVLYTDYEHLQGYVFLEAGKDRIADRIARIVRLVPNDDFRYSYTLWIDIETNLLLQSQLLDKESKILEEFRVIQLYQSSELEMIASAIDAIVLPSLVATEKEDLPSAYHWSANWLPMGFKLVNNQTMKGRLYASEEENVDSHLYSDGLSTFNIYIMPSQGVNFNEYTWQQGKLTILNQTIDGKDVVIIGEVPAETAKKVVENIKFSGDEK